MKTAVLVVLALVALLVINRLTTGEIMDPAEVARRVAGGQAVLIDVREPAEWAATGVATPAALLSLSDLQGNRTQWLPYLEAHRGKELILQCRSGNRSGIAARLLAKEGWATANAGAFKDWAAAGLPVREAKSR
jgi:rhodanese-related sulfurtransferase